MRIADIIKLKDKDFTSQKRFPYALSEPPKEDRGLQMKKLEAEKDNSSGEDSKIAELYQSYLTQTRSIFEKAESDFNLSPARDTIQDLNRELVDKLLLSDIDIINFFMRSGEENYLYSHSVNVAFLSVMLGVWLNYNKSDLNQLATAAILHDIGMIKVLNLALLPRRLKSSERKKVGEHPNHSREFVARISDIDDRVIEAVGNHHQRLGGSSRFIDGHSQIIGLVDTFEAMTHPRAYKRPLEPHSAIRKIIDELKNSFDLQIIKALIDNIGLYPIGTWIRLDTEEIGLVIDMNSGFPLSPKITILFNKDEKVLAEPRTVDLSKQKNIHIKSPLEEEVEDRLKETVSCKG